MSAAPRVDPEFSRPEALGGLGTERLRRQIAADAEECRALARRFGLRRLGRLEGRLWLERAGQGLVRLSGEFGADVVQDCVVTLEPVATAIEERFTLFFSEQPRGVAEDVDVPLDDEKWPEPVLDGAIDLGEALAQQLAVALDPYPRAPGAAGAGAAAGDRLHWRDEPEPAGPFRSLAGLAGKR